MKKILLYLSIFVLLISCATNPTEKQKEFAKELQKTPGILHTEWQTNLSLWIQVDLNSLGSNPKLQAQQLADKIASKGLKYIERSICVNIYYGNGNFLAESCLNY